MTVIKKVKDPFFKKQAEYIIYSYDGKNWVFKVTGEPMNDLDLKLLMEESKTR